MFRHITIIFSTLLILLLSINQAFADSTAIAIPTLASGSEVFIATISVQNVGQGSPTTKTFRANGSFETIIDKFKNADLTSEFSGGSGFNEATSSVSGTMSLRGVKLTAQVYTENSVRKLVFCLQGSECQTFQQTLSSSSLSDPSKAVHAASSQDLWDQLIDYLKGQGGTTLLDNLATSWVEDTSIDPVAGNPRSLMGQITKANFNLATNGILTSQTSGLNLFSVTPSYGYNTTDGITVKDAYLPLKYSHYFNNDNALFFDVPISYDQIEQAQSYSLAMGLGYMHVFIRHPHLVWALTPSFYAGVVGSVDLGSGTLMYNGAIASRLLFPYGKLTYGITNDVSFSQTAKLKIGDITTPYDLNSTLTSNGFDVTYLFHKDYTVGGYYTLTNQLGGTEWYISNYNELGFKFAMLKHYNKAIYDHMTFSAGYLFGSHGYKGGDVSLGFNF